MARPSRVWRVLRVAVPVAYLATGFAWAMRWQAFAKGGAVAALVLTLAALIAWLNVE